MKTQFSQSDHVGISFLLPCPPLEKIKVRPGIIIALVSVIPVSQRPVILCVLYSVQLLLWLLIR